MSGRGGEFVGDDRCFHERNSVRVLGRTDGRLQPRAAEFLVVDDNKHMRALVKTILHSLGTKNVVEAADGADAFKELRHFPADIIICDWNMSPLDGLDFVRLVRTGKDSPNPFAAIIMLTGHTEMHRVVEARDAGVHEFLAKRFRPEACIPAFAPSSSARARSFAPPPISVPTAVGGRSSTRARSAARPSSARRRRRRPPVSPRPRSRLFSTDKRLDHERRRP